MDFRDKILTKKCRKFETSFHFNVWIPTNEMSFLCYLTAQQIIKLLVNRNINLSVYRSDYFLTFKQMFFVVAFSNKQNCIESNF